MHLSAFIFAATPAFGSWYLSSNGGIWPWASFFGFSSKIKHLPWIKDPIGVQAPPQFTHHPHLGISGKLGQKRLFCNSNTVFARDRATQPYCLIEDLFECFLDSGHFFLI